MRNPPAWTAPDPSSGPGHWLLRARVFEADDLKRAIIRIAHEIVERNHGATDVVLVGLYTRGVYVARRLAAAIASFEGVEVPVGALDVSFYRDDYEKIGLHRDPKRSHVPFEVEGRPLVLVDDVLYTGRTIRAALHEIFDYGRPASVKLAVLVDRDGRQLPIAAQFAGTRVALGAGQSVGLKRDARGRLSLEVREEQR